MKIALIGPGIMSIPPKGWGGVEALIENYRVELERRGHDVLIVNTKDMSLLKYIVDSWKADFLHLHYDVYVDVLKHLNCKVKAVTSHFPYIDVPHLVGEYRWIFEKFAESNEQIFCLSNKNKNNFIKNGANESNVWVWLYGINTKKFNFVDEPLLSDKSVCLGKIEPRKDQYRLQKLNENIDFIGPISDRRFKLSENYIGIWSREQVYNNLTNYANLILLSDGESFAQVIPEALACGLGVVVSEEASANLDSSLPFIDVVNREKISDNELSEIIRNNRINSLIRRRQIQEYARENFDIEICVNKYIEKIKSLIDSSVNK